MHYFNGHQLFRAIQAGAINVINAQQELNKINVFPVRDKDTGSNLAATLQHIIDHTTPTPIFKQTLDQIAEQALIGAKGNSGVIFAQFLFSLNQSMKDQEEIHATSLIACMIKTIPELYKAMAKPVEGTMITIIRVWIEWMDQHNNKQNFNQLITDSIPTLEQALEHTKKQLEQLRKHNVVDAGAKGFVLFIKGIKLYIDGKTPQLNKTNTIDQDQWQKHIKESINHQNSQFRYCTEALLKDSNLEKHEIATLIHNMGDSLLIAGNRDHCRIHIHSNHPEEVMAQLHSIGSIRHQKVDDMLRQQQPNKYRIALLTDSTTDLSAQLIDHYQIHVIPHEVSINGQSYLDGVTIKPNQLEQLYPITQVRTNQINQKTFEQHYLRLTEKYDAIIAIHLSNHLSGTYSNSLKAAQAISSETNIPIHVIDSKQLSGATGLIVLKAAQLIENHLDTDTILAQIDKIVNNTHIYVSVFNLKHMINSGRLPAAIGYFLHHIGFSPIVTMSREGKGKLLSTTFGQKANIRRILKRIKHDQEQRAIQQYVILHINAPQKAQLLSRFMYKITKQSPACIVEATPMIGANVGKGSVAIAFQQAGNQNM